MIITKRFTMITAVFLFFVHFNLSRQPVHNDSICRPIELCSEEDVSLLRRQQQAKQWERQSVKIKLEFLHLFTNTVGARTLGEDNFLAITRKLMQTLNSFRHANRFVCSAKNSSCSVWVALCLWLVNATSRFSNEFLLIEANRKIVINWMTSIASELVMEFRWCSIMLLSEVNIVV